MAKPNPYPTYDEDDQELDLEDLAADYYQEDDEFNQLNEPTKERGKPEIKGKPPLRKLKFVDATPATATFKSKKKGKHKDKSGLNDTYYFVNEDYSDAGDGTGDNNNNNNNNATSFYRPSSSFLGRVNTASRITSGVGSLFGLVLVSAIWLFGASSSLVWLRQQKLVGVDSPPWNWLVWPLLVDVTCFQIRYMPPFLNPKRLLLCLRYHPWITGLWLFIAGLDMGSTFHALLPLLLGKHLSLYIWDVDIAGPIATLIAAILAALIGLGPEPLARVFARLLLADLKD